jgi:hypothetical protein
MTNSGKTQVWKLAIFTVLSGALGLQAMAHHSGAAYDNDHPVSIPATVKSVNWSNPHIIFQVESDPKDGTPPVAWAFEASSPGVLIRAGWTKKSLQPGEHAIFHVSPLRDNSHGGFLNSATLDNGQTLTYSLTVEEK